MSTSAGAESAFDPSQLQKCTAYIDTDGNDIGQVEACLPVDPFTEPGLTLAQRLKLVNADSSSYDELSQQLKDKFGD